MIVVVVVTRGGDPRGGRLIHCGYVDNTGLSILRNSSKGHLVEVVARAASASKGELIKRLPTPQGPFWTRKTYACSNAKQLLITRMPEWNGPPFYQRGGQI